MEENEQEQQTGGLAQDTTGFQHTNHRGIFSHELGPWLFDSFTLWIN
jgi:hypothetical protein